jgi:hypothetical protein
MYPNRALSAGPIVAPFHRTAPWSSSTSPNTARMAVVLPAPFGPRKPVSRPGRAENVHRSRAITGPNRFVTPSKPSIPITLTENHPPGQRPIEANDPPGRDQ